MPCNNNIWYSPYMYGSLTLAYLQDREIPYGPDVEMSDVLSQAKRGLERA